MIQEENIPVVTWGRLAVILIRCMLKSVATRQSSAIVQTVPITGRLIRTGWNQAVKKWRNDGKCGDQPYYNSLPDGSIAECNPDGDRPCCSHIYCSPGLYSAAHRRESGHRQNVQVQIYLERKNACVMVVLTTD